MATSNEKQVQLKRESLLNDEVVLEDVFPKTMTDAVTDINTGAKMSEVLDTIMTVINNKLSRTVNSVNGRTGVVLLDASDVGLGNVDNVSTADLKAWVINYVASQFHNKHLILKDYYSGIQALIDTNNDEYDGVPFVCRHYTEDSNDETMVIGYMFNDGTHLTSEYYTFNFGDKGVGRFEYDSNENVLGEYFNVYTGDKRNKALGLYSTAKGYGNTTSAQSSMICGNENTIDDTGVNSFVTGNNNSVTGNKNGIVFGDGNIINDNVTGSSIIGGYGNKNIGASGNNIVCGAENTADADTQSSIVSGRSNDVTGVYDSLIIGYENTVDHSSARGTYATTSIIVSGCGNNVSDSITSIVSGYNNTVSDSEHGVISGDMNKATSAHAFAALGELNTIQNAHASMVGGFQSTASRSQAIAWGTRVEAKGSNSVIFGTSTNGLNPETVGDHMYRYGGVQNMAVDEIVNTHETTPFSIAYGTSSFVAGRDNLGIGNYSFTIGNKNVNKSPYSFVSGVNNEATANPGIVIAGTNNNITGYYSYASGIRNTVSGHNVTIRGAFNFAGSYGTVVGVGSSYNPNTDIQNLDVNLYFNTAYGTLYSRQNRLIRSADYIDIPVPLIFQPLKAKNMVFKLKYQNTNVWSDNTTTEHTISSTGDSIFEWRDDIKTLRISRDALNTQFGFTHSVTPGETSYDLDVLDLTDVSFEISITFVTNASDRVGVNAFNVGNGPFADDAYRDQTGHANAFEVHWDGTTVTQKDIQLRYKANPNTADAPIDISFKKLVDVLISNGTINLNDIVST